MSDECIELKNIQYKSMLLDPNGFKNKDGMKSNVKTIEEVIQQQDTDDVFLKPWSKLDKVSRLKKLKEYVGTLVEKGEITASDTKGLYTYLKQCLERKKLQRIKDVNYDKDKGVITEIPGLQITLTEKRKFTLKNSDKKTSTLKNLTRIRKKNRQQKSKVGEGGRVKKNKGKEAISVSNENEKI